ncbi:MAG: WD40 repeat domain-containing protein, partial [Planctomycetota bacterium]
MFVWDYQRRASFNLGALHPDPPVVTAAFDSRSGQLALHVSRCGQGADLAVLDVPYRLASEHDEDWLTEPEQGVTLYAAMNWSVAGGVAFVGHGNVIAAWGQGHQIMLFDRKSLVFRPLLSASCQVTAMGCTGGNIVMSATENGEIQIWDIERQATQPRMDHDVFHCPEYDVRFSPDGRLLASSANDTGRSYGVRVWDVDAMDMPRELILQLTDSDLEDVIGRRVQCFAFASAGHRLMWAEHPMILRFWDVERGVEYGAAAILSKPAERRTIVCDSAVEAWSAIAGRWETEDYCTAVAVSDSGDLAVYGSRHGLVGMWNVAGATKLWQRAGTGHGGVTAINSDYSQNPRLSPCANPFR